MKNKTLDVNDLIQVVGSSDNPKAKEIRKLIEEFADLLESKSDDPWVIYSVLASLTMSAALAIVESHGHKCRETAEVVESLNIMFKMVMVRFLTLPEMDDETEETKH